MKIRNGLSRRRKTYLIDDTFDLIYTPETEEFLIIDNEDGGSLALEGHAEAKKLANLILSLVRESEQNDQSNA